MSKCMATVQDVQVALSCCGRKEKTWFKRLPEEDWVLLKGKTVGIFFLGKFIEIWILVTNVKPCLLPRYPTSCFKSLIQISHQSQSTKMNWYWESTGSPLHSSLYFSMMLAQNKSCFHWPHKLRKLEFWKETCLVEKQQIKKYILSFGTGTRRLAHFTKLHRSGHVIDNRMFLPAQTTKEVAGGWWRGIYVNDLSREQA